MSWVWIWKTVEIVPSHPVLRYLKLRDSGSCVSLSDCGPTLFWSAYVFKPRWISKLQPDKVQHKIIYALVFK